jgi:regulation of enolase protein 1 (concanavalin A-like superfamily)
MWYRLNRLGQDFYIENSTDGKTYRQMRMLHLHKVSEKVQIGVYACSPLKSDFNAVFSEFGTGPCLWPDYEKHK